MQLIRHWRIISPVLIIETSVFTRCITALMEDEQYAELQAALVQRPDQGDLIPGSGGLRKIRWKASEKGKRGGVRIIYYWMRADEQLWMLYAYAKTRQENLTRTQLANLRTIVERWSDE
jgi:hypothetical protein